MLFRKTHLALFEVGEGLWGSGFGTGCMKFVHSGTREARLPGPVFRDPFGLSGPEEAPETCTLRLFFFGPLGRTPGNDSTRADLPRVELMT